MCPASIPGSFSGRLRHEVISNGNRHSQLVDVARAGAEGWPLSDPGNPATRRNVVRADSFPVPEQTFFERGANGAVARVSHGAHAPRTLIMTGNTNLFDVCARLRLAGRHCGNEEHR